MKTPTHFRSARLWLVAVFLIGGWVWPRCRAAIRRLRPHHRRGHPESQVRVITLFQLEQSLPPHPINVVFDVDDTALFTSAGFQWGTRTYGADIVSAGVSVREEDLPTAEAKRKYREFWWKMNNELDQYSVKKWIAGELSRCTRSAATGSSS
jgi:acid phosphatase class B